MAMTAADIAQVNQRPEGLWRDEHHRYFYGDKGPYPSVTTIAKVLDKSGPLVGWAKREVAACAIRNHDLISQMLSQDGGKEAAESWLRGIPDYQRDTSAELGTRIHDLVHQDIMGRDIAPTGVEVPYMRAWRRAVGHIKPKTLLSEAMVINIGEGFGGTLDLGWVIDGVDTLVDIKTGARVYNEVAIQLAGYDIAEFTATPEDPKPVQLPSWKRYAVLHLQPDDWSLIPVDVNDEARAAFRSAIALSDYTKSYAPCALGRPIKEGV
jgi:hypothetical protein